MKIRKQRLTALICYLMVVPALLVACGPGGTPASQPTATPAQATSPAAEPATAPPAPTTAPATAPVVVTPAPTTPPAPTAPAAATATSEPAPPAPTQPGAGSEPGYLDDRSAAETVIISYYNAINRKEYARAYSYWQSQAGAPDGPPPFAEFAQGYADTAAVQVQLGPIGAGAAAGQRYFTVPVVLTAQTTSGAGQRFAGCYTLHLADPQLQAEPPFRPLGIQSASIQQVTGDTDTPALLAQACQGQGNPQPAPTQPPADPTDIGPSRYLDNRSGAVEVLQSFYNAINRKEYARAYSYWQSQAGTPGGPPPFAEFAQGYAETAAVELRTGTPRGDAGAGQRYFSVPVVLTAQTTSGATQRFAGCYTLHLANPQIQAEPPFRPLGIQSASIQEVAGDTDMTALLSQECS